MSLKTEIDFFILRYAKMQYQSLSNPSDLLSFEDIVPQTTSNAHVASAALYHCLGVLYIGRKFVGRDFFRNANFSGSSWHQRPYPVATGRCIWAYIHYN